MFFSTIVAACFLLVGPSTLGIHLASVLVGLAMVLAVCFVGGALFNWTDLVDEGVALRRWGALVAALMIAVSYWHLNWSRYGVRAILVPLFAALTFAFLWQALRRGDRRAFRLCGISLGLSLYSYQAAHLLPVLAIVGCATAAWKRRSITRRDWTNILTVGGGGADCIRASGHPPRQTPE
jgi:4-amino-4-deoxy-L-arabinose transferase-like glycosyltransferase